MGYNWKPSSSHATTTGSLPVAPLRPPPAATSAPTVATLVEEFIEAAADGRAPNRSGRRYRPSALRDLRGILRHHVVGALGDMPLRDVRRQHVQALVDRLLRDELSESRIRSVVSALRALYGYAIERGYAEFNPADGLTMARDDEAARFGRDHSLSREDPPDEAGEHRSTIRGGRRSRRDDPAREARKASRAGPDGSAYQPIALLPERILSLALRAVFVLFVLIAVLSLTQSA